MQTIRSEVNVVAKAAQVLKACHQLGPGLSLGDIARHLALPRSTVQRIVQTLIGEGLLSSNGSARSIGLGPALLEMGANVTMDVVERAKPFLKQLSVETGETVDLARFNRDHMLFINQITGAHRLQAVSAIGDVFPMHCTANGKAALALLAPADRQRVLGSQLRSYTGRTKVNRGLIESELEIITASGIASDIEEHALGICALGIAVRDRANQIYAISMPVPTVRFKANRSHCEKALRVAAQQFAEALTDPPRERQYR